MLGQTTTLIATILSWIDIARAYPGDGVNEGELVVEFGVPRAPVREALITARRSDEAMGRHPQFDQITAMDLLATLS